MAGDVAPTEERQRRLQQVRHEIERELGLGVTLHAADWLGRYPDLEPELGIMLREMIGKVGTRVVAGPSVEAPGATEAGPIPPRPSTEVPGAETVDVSMPTELATPGDPRAAATPSAQETTAAASGAEARPRGRRADGLAAGQKVRYIGDYETISVLGQGGMGVVYKARQLTLNRLVALKMIRNAEFANEDQVRRFQGEAEAVATLDHPGIVPIFEVGTFEDQRYFSMKLIEGQGLDRKLEELAKDPRAAARVVAEVADAVNHAHQRGILHRDLKPANILVDGEGHAHVTDFGLAKRIQEDAGLTVSGAIMGTPSYMAPEQAAGQSSLVTTASDVYGLGAILYAALTGRAPFAGDSVMNTLDQVRNSPPQPPTRLNAELPRNLEVICLKCLEKDPRHRYASAQALSDDLKRWLRGEPIAARPVGPAVRLRMWARRKPALAGLSAALIVASIAGVVGIAWQWREAVSQRNLGPDRARRGRPPGTGGTQGRGRSHGRARPGRREREERRRRPLPGRAERPGRRHAGHAGAQHHPGPRQPGAERAPGPRPPRLQGGAPRLGFEADRRRRRDLREVHQQGGHHRRGAHGAGQDLPAARPDPKGFRVVPEMPRDHQGTCEDQELQRSVAAEPGEHLLRAGLLQRGIEPRHEGGPELQPGRPEALRGHLQQAQARRLPARPQGRPGRPGRGLHPGGRHPVSDGRAHRRAGELPQGLQPPSRAGRRAEGRPPVRRRT